MSTSDPGLLGRRREYEVLGELLDDVCAGRSRVLVLRGDPGVGKTALLQHLARTSSGCDVIRVVGVESEMELPFAGLHQLCAPLLERLAQIPRAQREALGTAFGLGSGEAPDRFLVGLAVLSLLSEAAGERPLVCLVDDAQWLDRASAQILAFVARRLLAESVAMVFATRGSSGMRDLAGLPERTLGGLGYDDARRLLDSAVHGRLDERVRDQIIAETGGNPLAMLELPRGLSGAELAGGFALPDARPLEGRIEQSFLRQLEAMPQDAQRLLRVAAAEPVGDAALLMRAVDQLGIDAAAREHAEATGLIEFGTRIRFRHPLVRSAAYRSTGPADRREIHRALADATDPVSDPDRRAWHRAHAAAAPDESVAADLERSAERARRRGGVAAAAAFLERAAELTPEPARRGARTLAAAQAKFEAADLDAAHQLLRVAELGPLDALQSARAVRLRAQIVFARRRGNDAPPLLLDAARQLETLDDDLARETYLEALAAAIFAGRLGGRLGMREIATAARAAPALPQPARPVDLLLDGVATLLTDGYAAGLPVLRRALQPFRAEALRSRDEIMRWLGLACPIAQEAAVHQLWDYDAWEELASRAVDLARETGAVAYLPIALVYLAGAHLYAGDFAGASAMVEEADAITAATGYAPVSYASLVLVAWRGDEARARTLIDATVADAIARGEGFVLAVAGFVTAVLCNGLGRYEAALDGARQACAHDDFGFVGWSLVELVEAAARSGAQDDAIAALERLDERARASDTDWALGLLAHSRALLSDGTDAESLHREAIARLGHSRVAVHLSRAHLSYGEWLRREGRRVDARAQLRVAHEMFNRFGAAAFAERARRELVAAGDTPRTHTSAVRNALTGQEVQIARLAAEGYTNPEIGGQLFISPRTVEYHLTKVFTKLGIRSRRDLRHALPDRDRAASPT